MSLQDRYGMGRVVCAMAVGVASLLIAGAVWAGEPRYEKPVLSDTKGGAADQGMARG